MAMVYFVGKKRTVTCVAYLRKHFGKRIKKGQMFDRSYP